MLSTIKFHHFFLLALFIRFIFLLCGYLFNLEPSSCCDWSRYNEISNNIVDGNFNLDAGPFVIAPIFPYFVSLTKIIYYDQHVILIQVIQILLSSISVIYLMKTSELLFNNKITTFITGLIYSLYPITFWYSFFLGQETIFQFFFIICIFYFVLFLKENNNKNIIKFSLFFALSFLTKSHVLIFFPFIFLILLIKNKNFFISIKNFVLVSLVIFFIALPHSITNKVINGFYVLSTTGVGHMFLVGHNDEFYKMVTNPPPKNSDEYKRIWSMDYNIMREIDEKFNDYDHLGKDKQRLIAGINWIRLNPDKTIKLLSINTINFFKPGFNKLHQDYLKWLISLIVSTPIIILAYLGILNKFYNDFSNHTIIFSLIITMLLFSIIFYSQNRFRVITIEPFYVMYASYMITKIIDKYFKKSLKSNI